MLAANRNDRVRGRTSTLVVSIITKNGFSQSGAPSGRKCAVDGFGACMNLEKIRLSHKGKPSVRVKIRWLERLNVYGIIPIKLIIIIIKNKEATIDENPFKDLDDVRSNCEVIVSVKSRRDEDMREFEGKMKDFMKESRRRPVTKKMVFLGINVLDMYGSNVEKMSGIIKIQARPI
jgi:hypothetical protein